MYFILRMLVKTSLHFVVLPFTLLYYLHFWNVNYEIAVKFHEISWNFTAIYSGIFKCWNFQTLICTITCFTVSFFSNPINVSKLLWYCYCSEKIMGSEVPRLPDYRMKCGSTLLMSSSFWGLLVITTSNLVTHWNVVKIETHLTIKFTIMYSHSQLICNYRITAITLIK